MTTLTREKLLAIRTVVQAALNSAGAADGVTLTMGRITFDPSGTFAFKVEGSIVGALTKEERRYNELRQYLHPELPELGAEFAHSLGRIKVTGCNTTGTKVFFTVIATGRTMQCKPEAMVIYASKVQQRLVDIAAGMAAKGSRVGQAS